MHLTWPLTFLMMKCVLKYFSLSELPFKITHDPCFLWYSDQLEDTKANSNTTSRKDDPAYLSAEINQSKAFLVSACAMMENDAKEY